MREFQVRVIEEKNDLDDNLKKLVAFLESAQFRELPVAERTRLHGQAHHMAEYSRILGERIAAFEE